MSVRLILGRAGSGKSTLIANEIVVRVEADPVGSPIWLLVPEQSTFQVEKALCDRLGGLMRVRVVSFQRLTHIVMNSVAGAALTPIGDIGRLMLVRKVIEEHKQDLRLFARAAQQPGFAAKVVELLSELKRCRVKPQDLSAARSLRLPPTLANKLHDLYLLYSSLHEKHRGVSLDSDDRLEWLDLHVSRFSPLRGAELYIYGFTGFTPQEYGILSQLIGMSDTSIALTLDPALLNQELDQTHPFFTPWETAKQLAHSAQQQGLAVAVSSLKRPTPEVNPGTLSYLEANYFDLTALPEERAPHGLKLIAAETRRTEVEHVARAITELCREHNYRYRDISVLARDLSLYEPLLSEVFAAYDLPFFLDKKRPIRHHPLLDLINSALLAVEQGFPYEPTLRCLKTDLWPLPRDVVDRIDNFALATGLRGRFWTGEEDWYGLGRESDIADVLNDARRTVAARFAPLAEKLHGTRTVHTRAEALMEFLAGLQVEEKLQQWAAELENRGDVEGARIHVQVGQAVDQLLAELVAALGSEELPPSDFNKTVASGLLGIALGLVPPCVDQVLILELGRSRVSAARAAFLIGVNDGLFPARQSPEGLLTDDERELLQSAAIRLGPSAHRKLFEEEFLVYVGFTRASERLTLSYALADEAGGALRPSPVVRRVQQLFPALKPDFTWTEAPIAAEAALDYLAHPYSAAGYLAAALRKTQAGSEASALWGDVYSYLLRDERSCHLVEILARGLRHRVKLPNLAKPLVNRLYGHVLRGSVSRLERYRACPFAHFAYYGLKLRERPMYKLAAVDIGNFFHLALDRFVTHMQNRRIDWAKATREEFKDIARGVVADLVPKIGILSSSARHKYLTQRLQQVVERSARVMGEHARRGKFRPVAVELGFGQAGDSLPATRITLADGTRLELSGRIDRVDTALSHGQLYVVVVDYKSGSNKLTPLEVYYGLKTQLLAYLEIVLEQAPGWLGKAALPAAAVYFRVQDPIFSSPVPLSAEDVEKQSQREFRLEGMVVADKNVVDLLDNAAADGSDVVSVRLSSKGEVSGASAWTIEQLTAMRKHLLQSLTQAGEEITAGTVDVAPYRLDKETACTFCEFLPVCQFDVRQPDGQFRRLEKHNDSEIWRILAE